MFDFSGKNRLKRKSDFESVFANPSKASHRYLLALYRPNSYSHARIGIILSKHRVKRAVDRNLIRRHIRESFRQQQTLLKGLDIVVLVRSECIPLKTRDIKALQHDINRLWQILLAKLPNSA